MRDIAAVAFKALTEDGHANKIYNITGKEAITHGQMADGLSRVLGRKIGFIDIAPLQMEGALRAAGFPEWQVGGLIEDYAHYAKGEASAVYQTVKDVTHHEAIGFGDFLDQYKELFLK